MSTPPKNKPVAHNPSYDEPEIVQSGDDAAKGGKFKVVIGAMVAVVVAIAVFWGAGYLAVDTDKGVDATAPSTEDKIGD